MTAEVELDVIIEALEMADDSISSYLDVETGEVHSITEEEFDLGEDPQTAMEDLPLVYLVVAAFVGGSAAGFLGRRTYSSKRQRGQFNH
jgi:hypothetical protein